MKKITVGRSHDADVVINDQYVSRKHMQLTIFDDGKVSIRDLNSKTGTFVNGKKIYGDYYLQNNDLVRIGKTNFPWRKYATKKTPARVQSSDDTLLKTKYLAKSPKFNIGDYKKYLYALGALLALGAVAYFVFLYHPMKTFNKTYSLNDDNEAVVYSICQTHDDGYIICGWVESPDDDDIVVKALLIKINSEGKKQWEKAYGDEKKQFFQNVIETTDNHFITVGYEETDDGIGILKKMDNEGNVIETKKFGNDDQSISLQKIINTSDGGYILVGTIYRSKKGRDIYVLKLDSELNKEWDKKLGGTDYEKAGSIIELKDGGYMVVGSTESKGKGSYDINVIKLEADGQKDASKTYGGSREDTGSDIIQTGDGFIVVGTTRSKGKGNEDVWVLKLDNDLKKEWQKTFGGRENDGSVGIISQGDKYIIAANTRSEGEGSYDAWFICIDKNGNEIWNRTYGGEKKDVVTGFIKTSDGGFAATGVNSSENDERDIWLLKLNEEGKLEKK